MICPFYNYSDSELSELQAVSDELTDPALQSEQGSVHTLPLWSTPSHAARI